MNFHIRVDRFWLYYFVIRILYLIFTIFIYARLTTLGDTDRYLTAPLSSIADFKLLISSTQMMDAVGSIFGTLGGSNILTNLPFTLLSFFTIKWVIDKYHFRDYIDNRLLLIVLSLPNFCVWTSVCSKETVGLVFSAILGSLIIDFLNRDYSFKKKDYFAIYLCLIFKPQYLPFIAQGLVMIYIMNKYLKSVNSKVIFGCFVVFCNLAVLYLISDLINKYAGMMYMHFDDPNANSTRDNIWINDNDFFYEAPRGMFVAFFGPTFNEMLRSPVHLIAGMESVIILVLFLLLGSQLIYRLIFRYRLNVTVFFSYFIIITGISLLHYPFGIFNPGSAIRYRTNFLFLFILLFLYLCKEYALLKMKQKTSLAINND